MERTSGCRPYQHLTQWVRPCHTGSASLGTRKNGRVRGRGGVWRPCWLVKPERPDATAISHCATPLHIKLCLMHDLVHLHCGLNTVGHTRDSWTARALTLECWFPDWCRCFFRHPAGSVCGPWATGLLECGNSGLCRRGSSGSWPAGPCWG